MKPRLKNAVWQRHGDQLQLVYDVRSRFAIIDPDGTVEQLLGLLREGSRTIAELAAALTAAGRAVSRDDVDAAVQLFDSYHLLEDATRTGLVDAAGQERYHSNLAFFETFATLQRGREEYQQHLRDAHVLVLGTGGLNANTIPHLCGLGVGRLTLLDRDRVEQRNFARQYLYRHRDIGSAKVRRAADWVREYDPTIKVEGVEMSVGGPADADEVVGRFAPDVVMAGIDRPDEIDDWVNHACVPRGVPYVRGGMYVTQAMVVSVDPGVSACRRCHAWAVESTGAAADGTADEETAALALFATKPSINRGIGPIAGLLGAYAAFELLRYLIRFEAPAHAAAPMLIDLSDQCRITQRNAWPRDPDCAECAPVAAGIRP